MLTSSIMKANASYEDIADVGAIPQYEWQVFLQGNILANMMDEKQLAEHDGIIYDFFYFLSFFFFFFSTRFSTKLVIGPAGGGVQAGASNFGDI